MCGSGGPPEIHDGETGGYCEVKLEKKGVDVFNHLMFCQWLIRFLIKQGKTCRTLQVADLFNSSWY